MIHNASGSDGYISDSSFRSFRSSSQAPSPLASPVMSYFRLQPLTPFLAGADHSTLGSSPLSSATGSPVNTPVISRRFPHKFSSLRHSEIPVDDPKHIEERRMSDGAVKSPDASPKIGLLKQRSLDERVLQYIVKDRIALSNASPAASFDGTGGTRSKEKLGASRKHSFNPGQTLASCLRSITPDELRIASPDDFKGIFYRVLIL